jgi:hypothetical protein
MHNQKPYKKFWPIAKLSFLYQNAALTAYPSSLEGNSFSLLYYVVSLLCTYSKMVC